MNVKSIKKVLQISSLITFMVGCFLAPNLFADSGSTSSTGSSSTSSTSSTSSSSNSSNPYYCASGGVDCLIAGYGVDQIQWLIQPPYDQSILMAVGNALKQSANTAVSNSLVPISQSVLAVLTTSDPTATINQAIQNIPSPLVASTTCPKPWLGPCPASSSDEQATSSYNLNTLLGPVVYQTKNGLNQQASAVSFIQTVSNMINPLPVVNFSSLPSGTDMNSLLTQPDVAKYLVAVRNFAAQEAAGLSTLYVSYGQRVPVPGLASAAGMPNSSSNSAASVLQVETYSATRRLSDPNWYSQMQNASPATIQREMLYLLAEIRLEMFRNRMQLERMNDTLAIMEIQNTQGQRRSISQLAQKVPSPLVPPPNE